MYKLMVAPNGSGERQTLQVCQASAVGVIAGFELVLEVKLPQALHRSEGTERLRIEDDVMDV